MLFSSLALDNEKTRLLFDAPALSESLPTPIVLTLYLALLFVEVCSRSEVNKISIFSTWSFL